MEVWGLPDRRADASEARTGRGTAGATVVVRRLRPKRGARPPTAAFP